MWPARDTQVWHSEGVGQMGNDQGYQEHARTPVFHESGTRNGSRPAIVGSILDPRFLGPAHPRVTVLGVAFRLHGRYYIGNPRGKPKRSVLMHRVVYAAMHGSVQDGCEVHHIDDDPFNNHPENLEALPKFMHRRQHKSVPRYQCVCRVCGITFGCYQAFGARCSPTCKRADHARVERERRASVQSDYRAG